MKQSPSTELELRQAQTMAAVPKHPHHNKRHGRHAADLSEHAEWLGFSVDNMGTTVDPRQDFYRFAAGRWLDKAIIPDTGAQVGGFIGLFHRVNDQILALLQDAAANSAGEAPGSVAQQVGDFYASAMDTARLEALGFAPLQPELDRLEAVADFSGLTAVTAHLIQMTGSPILLAMGVMPDKKQSGHNTFSASFPSTNSSFTSGWTDYGRKTCMPFNTTQPTPRWARS